VTAGYNYYGQLGLGDTEDRGREMGYYDDNSDWIIFNGMGDNLPAVSLGTGLTATAIACGSHHTCALLSNAQLKCWGGSRIILSLPCPRRQGASDLHGLNRVDEIACSRSVANRCEKL